MQFVKINIVLKKIPRIIIFPGKLILKTGKIKFLI